MSVLFYCLSDVFFVQYREIKAAAAAQNRRSAGKEFPLTCPLRHTAFQIYIQRRTAFVYAAQRKQIGKVLQTAIEYDSFGQFLADEEIASQLVGRENHFISASSSNPIFFTLFIA